MGYPKQEEFGELPTIDTSRRHSADQELRKAGWRIHSRPKSSEAVWEKDGQQMPESKALKSIGLTHIEEL